MSSSGAESRLNELRRGSRTKLGQEEVILRRFVPPAIAKRSARSLLAHCAGVAVDDPGQVVQRRILSSVATSGFDPSRRGALDGCHCQRLLVGHNSRGSKSSECFRVPTSIVSSKGIERDGSAWIRASFRGRTPLEIGDRNATRDASIWCGFRSTHAPRGGLAKDAPCLPHGCGKARRQSTSCDGQLSSQASTLEWLHQPVDVPTISSY